MPHHDARRAGGSARRRGRGGHTVAGVRGRRGRPRHPRRPHHGRRHVRTPRSPATAPRHPLTPCGVGAVSRLRAARPAAAGGVLLVSSRDRAVSSVKKARLRTYAPREAARRAYLRDALPDCNGADFNSGGRMLYELFSVVVIGGLVAFLGSRVNRYMRRMERPDEAAPSSSDVDDRNSGALPGRTPEPARLPRVVIGGAIVVLAGLLLGGGSDAPSSGGRATGHLGGPIAAVGSGGAPAAFLLVAVACLFAAGRHLIGEGTAKRDDD